jgi:hypothetical protein
MTDPMSDERLAQFSIAALSPFPFDHPATQIVQNAFDELLAEAKRARGEEKRLRARVADEISVIGHGFERDEELRDLLGSISLYVNWRFTTKQLTTEQKELWARAVDAWSQALQAADGYAPELVADRWWRGDA